MKIQFSLLLFFMLSSSTVNAERGIARCVDKEGNLTYTDFLCVTSERGNNSALMTDQAVNRHIRDLRAGVTSKNSVVSPQLRLATNQAMQHCTNRFSRYFRRKHPDSAEVPSIDFSNIVDQYMDGSNVSISLNSTIQYTTDTGVNQTYIECTVQKFSEGDDHWLVGFLER